MKELIARFGAARLLEVLGVASLLLLVVSLVGVPWLVARVPSDYFVRPSLKSKARSARAVALGIARNSLGALLVVAGLAMLALPGQGLITLLVGVGLLDVPGKHRLLLWVLSKRPVHAAIDALRRRAGRPPLELPTRGDR